MSGLGATGPLSHKGAFDLTIQAEGGYMSLTGEADGTPIKLGTSAFDLICGQYAMSDQIIVMREGRIEQSGRPLDIYDAPRSRFIADFIGAANILEVDVTGRDEAGRVLGRVGAAQMVFASADTLPSGTAKGMHLAAVRTVYPRIAPDCGEAGENRWPARIERREMLGDVVAYTIGWPGGTLRVHAFPSQMLEEGRTVMLHIPPERAILVAADA